MGRALAELFDRKLYFAVGHPTFAALVEDRCRISYAVANRLVAIYRSIPRQAALQLGPEKAMEWLRLLRVEAGPGAEPADVRRLADAKPQPAAGSIAAMSTREIAELRRRLQARREVARRDPGAAEAHRIARALAWYLHRIGAEDARVGARYGGGRWRIRADLAVAAARVLLDRKR